MEREGKGGRDEGREGRRDQENTFRCAIGIPGRLVLYSLEWKQTRYEKDMTQNELNHSLQKLSVFVMPVHFLSKDYICKRKANILDGIEQLCHFLR